MFGVLQLVALFLFNEALSLGDDLRTVIVVVAARDSGAHWVSMGSLYEINNPKIATYIDTVNIISVVWMQVPLRC